MRFTTIPLHPYLGHAVELGTYDEALMSAVPIPDPDLEEQNHPVTGRELPSPINPAFRLCFPYPLPDCRSECAKTRPVLEGVSTRRFLPESRSALKTIRADSCQPFHAKSDYLFPPDDMAKFVIFFAANRMRAKTSLISPSSLSARPITTSAKVRVQIEINMFLPVFRRIE